MKITQQIPASFTRRGFAYILDILVILLVIITPFYNNIDKSSVNLKSIIKPELDKTHVIAVTIISILVVLYWAIFEYLFGQSIGKMLIHIQVISLNKTLKFSQTLIRNISKITSILVLLDCLNIVFSKTNQRFLEKISKTQVITK